jgi:hypothetical protein
MIFQRATKSTFLMVAAGGLATYFALTVALAQSRPAGKSDPLSTYVGTWVATDPGESAPFLVLRLSVVNAELQGTISHFKIGGVRNGEFVLSPLTFAESPISDLTLADSSLWFAWDGDAPFHGGEMKFIAEGTNVARLQLFMNQGEEEEIFAHNKGLRGLPPRIQLHREGTVGSQDQLRDPANDWKPMATIWLINEAEVQYRFDHGVYADYATLLNSGQLDRTGRYNWTLVPVNLQLKSEPLPGYIIRLVVSPDGESHVLSIVQKTSVDCASGFYSDETGVIAQRHGGNCPIK